MNNKAYYTMREFCDETGIHYNTAWRMIKSGRLSAFKIGVSGKTSDYRIPASELNRLAEVHLGEIVDELVEKKMVKEKSK